MKTTLIALSVILSGQIYAAERLTIYLSSPEKELNWNSPGSLYKSLLWSRATLTKRPFGSAVALLSCGDEKAFSIDPESFDVVGPVVFQGRGLGHLFSAHPGKFLTSEEAKKKAKESELNFSFTITPAHCERILTYAEEFKKHNIARNYGLPHRPLMAEGATDTSFVVSLLEVAGLVDPHQDLAWQRVVFLPNDLSGPPLKDQYVSIFSLLNGSWGNLKNSTVLRFWDPTLIMEWVKADPARANIDRLQSPVPEGNFWKQAIDPRYFKEPKSP